MDVINAIRGYGIPDLRRISPTVVAGPTLETKPKLLDVLKQNGIETIVDFRGGQQPIIENACHQKKFNYFNFNFNHVLPNKKGTNLPPEDFVEQLKTFFRVMNKGNAYIGCQYGVHRTNAALLYNYFLNPERFRFNTPRLIVTEGDKGLVNTANYMIRKVWHTVKQMSSEDKIFFGLKGDTKEIFMNFFAEKIGEIKKNVRIRV